LAAALAEADRLENLARQMKEKAEHDARLAEAAANHIAEEEAMGGNTDDFDFTDHSQDSVDEGSDE